MRKLLIAIAILLLLFAAVLLIMSSSLVKPTFVVRAEALLPMNQKASWQLLTDFSAYPDWNPYLLRVEGEFAVGQTLEVELSDGNFEGTLIVTPTMTEIVPESHFCWNGKLFLPGLFDTRHCFVLQADGDGSTRLEQYEEFGGLAARLFPAEENMAPHTEAAFKKMHEAMQKRAVLGLQ